MPELPEVETVRRALQPRLIGATIAAVRLHRPNLRFPFPVGFTKALEGHRVQAVERRAKYLVFDLEDGGAFAVHLGMTGTLRIESEQPHPGAHDHVEFDLQEAGRSSGTLVYRDPRRFGYMLHAPAGVRLEKIDRLGVEPLRGRLSGAVLTARLAGRGMPIKAALLDQRIVAGLGNIYVCEALWRTGVSPRRRACDLTLAEVEALALAIVEIIEEAIACGGSTLRDYRKLDGSTGGFQERFDVYARHGQSCRRVGCEGAIVRTVMSGRATFACAECQSD